MKNLKKKNEFSKMLDLGKEDIANLTENEMTYFQGGRGDNTWITGWICPTWTQTAACSRDCTPGPKG